MARQPEREVTGVVRGSWQQDNMLTIKRWLGELVADLRYAIRSLMWQKAFVVTAVFTLAVGIGTTTAVFSVVNGVLLRPLPFAQPDLLVQRYGTSPLAPR